MEVYQIMIDAAADATLAFEENRYRAPSFRMSRAGLPLLQLAMEDFIIPKLPVLDIPVKYTKSSLKSTMAISTGHLYSRAVTKDLQLEYPDYELTSEVKLNWRGITGTCDHLLINHLTQQIIVVECKALGVKTLAEAKANKLMVDNWGYYSQLCLYMAALQQQYTSDYEVVGQWRVWAKQAEKSFTQKLPISKDVLDTAYKADHRHGRYKEFAEGLQFGDIERTVEILVDSLDDDPMPEKTHFYGSPSASCGFHFNPWHAAILDYDGLPYENLPHRLTTILSYITGKQTNPKKVLQLLDN